MPGNRHTIAVDWDGTCVEQAWPEMGDWMPGAVDALRTLSEHAYVVIWTARIAPIDPWGGRRSEADVAASILQIRNKLDSAGLTQIDIFTGGYKPGASVYIDDKAERYHGRPGSWRAMTEKVLARVLDEESIFPALDNLEVTS